MRNKKEKSPLHDSECLTLGFENPKTWAENHKEEPEVNTVLNTLGMEKNEEVGMVISRNCNPRNKSWTHQAFKIFFIFRLSLPVVSLLCLLKLLVSITPGRCGCLNSVDSSCISIDKSHKSPQATGNLGVAALFPDVFRADRGLDVDGFHIVGSDSGAALFVGGIPKLLLTYNPVNFFISNSSMRCKAA